MPDGISSGIWIDLMRQGEFEEAWKFSDDILKSGYNRDYLTLPRHYQCIWDGSTLAGKRVLIRCYHGLGDTIMFIRYAPLVKAIASEVIVWVQPKLLELLKIAEGIDRMLPLHDGIPEAGYDADVEIMELSHVFRTTLPTIPLKMPYLHVSPVRIAPEDTFNVGLVWKAGDWDLSRNVPFELLDPLFELNGVNICILQDKAEDAGWREGCGIHPGECTLFDHARIIAGLDLMITVDSMPAHLAGALNIPTWVLLSHQPDWRWMEERTDSPWYPSIRLFRQERAGDWYGVIDKVINELMSVLSSPVQRLPGP